MREDTILSEYTGTSFFNSIGMIDVERLHSSMIKWILSDDCGAFSQNTKGEILSEIFKINNKGLHISRSQTEWKNMDIIFETSNGEVWVIENKIKCELHDNQLAKYSDIILNEKLEFSGDETSAHFAYLTLLPMKDQTAVCKNKKKAIWKNITHGDIAETLSNASYDGQNELDKNIVQAYAKALSELAQNAKDALNYPKMLFEPRKCKVPQYIASYIEKYNLRNILQRYYFYSILKSVYDGVQKEVGFDTNDTTIRVSPAANGGTAVLVLDLHSRLPEFPDAIFGIQLQDGSYKIDITIDYDNVKDVNINRNKLKNAGWMGDNSPFLAYKSQGWRINNPRSRARISISRKEKEMDWSCDAIKDKFIKCYKICQSLIENTSL